MGKWATTHRRIAAKGEGKNPSTLRKMRRSQNPWEGDDQDFLGVVAKEIIDFQAISKEGEARRRVRRKGGNYFSAIMMGENQQKTVNRGRERG